MGVDASAVDVRSLEESVNRFSHNCHRTGCAGRAMKSVLALTKRRPKQGSLTNRISRVETKQQSAVIV